MKIHQNSLMNFGFKILRITAILMVLPLMTPAQAAMEQEYLRLKQLRETNPEVYQKEIQDLKARVRSGLQEVKSRGDDSYQQFIKERIRHRQERLNQIRKENPEQFQEIMDQRKNRMEVLREKNPEQFQRFLDKHPEAAKRLERWNKNKEDVQKSADSNPGISQDNRQPAVHKNQRSQDPAAGPRAQAVRERKLQQGPAHPAGLRDQPFVSEPLRESRGQRPGAKSPLLSEKNRENRPAMGNAPEAREQKANLKAKRELPNARPRRRQ